MMAFAILKFVVISGVITLGIAVGLILSQKPKQMPEKSGLDFSAQLARSDQPVYERSQYTARDGAKLPVLHVKSSRENAPLLILVHGSGWHGQQYDAVVQDLSEVADILVPDLRGHGANPARRGDIDYIGQYEDDLADLIKAYARDGQKVVLGGHSSGGGLVVRFAGGAYGDMIDGAVLLAPFLKYNAPTTRPNSGEWTHVLTRRLIGLSMLNTARIRALNGLTVMQFSMPKQVLDGPLGHTATTAYSYRLNTSYAPRAAYLDDIKALPPFVLIAGTKDEAFVADQYQPLMQGVTDKGAYNLVEGASHLEIVNAPETLGLIKQFLAGL